MKKFLLGLFFIAFLCFSYLAKGQSCDISNVVIDNIVPRVSTATSCEVTLDVSFTIARNRGNKFIFIHAWVEADYPNYFQCQNGAPTVRTAPRAANLAGAFLNIGIDNFRTTPTIIGTYPPDPTVPLNTSPTLETEVLTSGGIEVVRVTLRNVTTTLPVSCSSSFTVKADVWSSQSAQAQNASCASCNITVPVIPLTIVGNANCVTDLFTAAVSNGGNAAVTGTYTVYVDLNNNRRFDAGVDIPVPGATGNITVNAGATVTVTGPVPSQFEGENLLFVIVSNAGIVYSGFLPAANCTVTPVTFKSFTADRRNQGVWLRWETAMEDNNRGFQVQRNTGTGWMDVAFVNTKAENGNSSMILSYEYTDVNAFQGVSQYRLLQVDNDGSARYSEIRAVRGEGQAARTVVYPNPSNDGQFNVIFDNTAAKDVYISDMNGRILKQWKKVTGSLQVAHLLPGMYNLRVIDLESGRQTTEKIVVH